MSFFNAAGNTHVVADVVGYYAANGSRFHVLDTPARLLDDRIAVGLSGPWGPAQSRSLPVAGVGPIPGSATALTLNTAVTNATAPSFITLYPDATPLPTTSNLNFAAGETTANLTITKIAPTGAIAIYNTDGNVDIVADAAGYFAPT